MRQLYAARLDDLVSGDFVQVECVCGHTMLLTAQMLTTAGLPGYENILGLQRRMRCRECEEKGKVVVSVKWADEAR